MACEAVEDLMLDAFQEAGRILAGEEGTPPPELPAGKSFSGLSQGTLELIRRHFRQNDLGEWLAAGADGSKTRLLTEFLDLDRLRREDFRTRYPRAFQKWSPEEDAWLLEQYETAKDRDGRIRWEELSDKCHRNANAIKIRLERLGVSLGPEGGRPRFYSTDRVISAGFSRGAEKRTVTGPEDGAGPP
jgi:hypothetical protein